jgi:hypothetical protein
VRLGEGPTQVTVAAGPLTETGWRPSDLPPPWGEKEDPVDAPAGSSIMTRTVAALIRSRPAGSARYIAERAGALLCYESADRMWFDALAQLIPRGRYHRRGPPYP